MYDVSITCYFLETFNASLGPPVEAPYSEDIGGVYIGVLSTILAIIVLLDVTTILGSKLQIARTHQQSTKTHNKWRVIPPPSYYRDPSKVPLDMVRVQRGPTPVDVLPAYYRR